jgi:hypothetical protein
MSEHKLAWALRLAADDDSVRFTAPCFDKGYSTTILEVLKYPDQDWQLVPKPHKWQKEIDAFNRGEIVQYRNANRLRYSDTWIDCPTPIQAICTDYYEYRIKPKTETRWLWAKPSGQVYPDLWKEPWNGYTVKLEWSATEFEVGE